MNCCAMGCEEKASAKIKHLEVNDENSVSIIWLYYCKKHIKEFIKKSEQFTYFEEFE